MEPGGKPQFAAVGPRYSLAMRADRDAYGRETLDHLAGVPAVEIVERDDGFIPTSVVRPPTSPTAAMAEPRATRPDTIVMGYN